MTFAGFVGSSTQTLTNAMHSATPYCARFVGLFQYRAVAVLTLTASTVGAVALSLVLSGKVLVGREDSNVSTGISAVGVFVLVGGVNIGVSKMLKLPLSRLVSVIITLVGIVIGGLGLPYLPAFR